MIEGVNGGVCLHEMFRQQADAKPTATAVIARETGSADKLITFTYAQLQRASDVYAVQLRGMGVRRDHIVGILMERNAAYPFAYIAALKAGGAYLPLDPAYPDAMLADVLKDATPTVVFCTEKLSKRLPTSQARIILTDQALRDAAADTTVDAKAGLAEVSPDDLEALAFAVYSSGTTGKPKGMLQSHRSSVFSYCWRFRNVPYKSDNQEVEACNVFFVWEMLRPLLRGQVLLVIPDDVIYDPPALIGYLAMTKATRMLFTPSLLEAVLDSKHVADLSEGPIEALHSLKTIVLCGEVVTVALQERCKDKLPWLSLWNLYSVSECHDVAAVDLAKKSYAGRKYCPVGTVFANVEAVVLDENLNELGVGTVGELYVAGPVLARGYLNLPELTANRFPSMTVPGRNGTRWYKSGDNARFLPTKELEILGRCDSMQKIRGYSVELRAVQAAIMALGGVTSCVVLVQGEEGQDKFIVAYVVLDTGKTTTSDVRLALKQKLPHYMVPSYFVRLEELPTHQVSGKLDPKSLPKVDPTRSSAADCTPPRNETEENLHKIFCVTMGMKQIDVIHDSFFDIGGHSLLAAKLVSAIKTHKVSVADLYAYPTVAKLASFIENGSPRDKAQERAFFAAFLKNEVEAHDVDKAQEISDLPMRAYWTRRKYRSGRDRVVLVTGSTGYLGAHILSEILRDVDPVTSQPSVETVYCLARSSAESGAALGRVKDSLHSRGLWRDSFADRVVAIASDVALHHFGLEDEDYQYLSTSVDVVYHVAAQVNMSYPYSGLRNTNVLGTRNVLQFCMGQKVKKLAYISTDGVFPMGFEEASEDCEIEPFAGSVHWRNGYSQSKWVAEMLCRRAVARGLPTIVFRPGNMGGDSGSRGGNGGWNTSDFNYLFVTGCVLLGKCPNLGEWVMEWQPVDVTAQVVVGLVGEGDTAIGETYHATNFAKSTTASAVFDAVRKLGYPLEETSVEDWTAALNESSDPRLAKLKLVASDLASDLNSSTFDNTKYSAAAARLGVGIPEMGEKMVADYVAQWRIANIIPACGKQRPLEGRVALVTGGSSGIGKAIASSLAELGASVCIGARREKLVKSIAESLSKKHKAKVVGVKVDVTDKSAVAEFAKECERQLGRVDILVNNAGVMHFTLMQDCETDVWEQEVDVNIKGTLNVIGSVLKGMVARGRGHIVNLSSDAGVKAFPGLSVYSGTKFFVEGMSNGLRQELAETGVKVTVVQPGDVKTEISANQADNEARKMYAQGSKERRYWLDPEDVASAVAFALTAPAHCSVNALLVEPRAAPA